MYTGAFERVSNAGGLYFTLELQDENGSPLDLSGKTLELAISDSCDSRKLFARSDDDVIAVTGVGVAEVTIDAGKWKTWKPDTYKLGLVIEDEDGSRVQWLIADLPLICGTPK